MPEHVVIPEIVVINDGGRRRWSASEKLRTIEETPEEGASTSVVARRNGVAPNLLYRWRRLILDGGAVAASEDDDVTANRAVRQMEERIRKLEPQFARKTLEVGILKGVLDSCLMRAALRVTRAVPVNHKPAHRVERPPFHRTAWPGSGAALNSAGEGMARAGLEWTVVQSSIHAEASPGTVAASGNGEADGVALDGLHEGPGHAIAPG